MRAWGVPGLGGVRSLRGCFARPLVAAVVGVVFVFCLSLSCVFRRLSSCCRLVVVFVVFSFFWLGRCVLGVGLALAVSAWGGGGLALVWLSVWFVVVAVLLCRPVLSAAARLPPFLLRPAAVSFFLLSSSPACRCRLALACFLSSLPCPAFLLFVGAHVLIMDNS